MGLLKDVDGQNLELLTSMSISRRQLLRRAAAIGLAAPAIAGLLAACGDDDSAVDPDDDAVDPVAPADDDEDEPVDDPDVDDEDVDDDPAADERRGGTLRVGFSGSVDNFDPHHQVQFDSIWVNSMIYGRLIKINADMELEPEMALSWEPDDSGLEWTFQLRDNAVFHNGREVTAEDWVYSLDRLRDPEEATPFETQIDMIEEVEALSDTELVIRLTGVYADLPILLGMYFMRVIPEEAAGDIVSTPVGSGPYELHSHSPDERTVLRRFEDYYNLEEEAFLDEIHYIKMEEETARLTALQGDTIDFVNEVSPTALPMVQDVPGLVVEEVVTGSYQPICMDVREEPFDDVRVRQALKLVIDRDEFMQAAIQGLGTTANDQPIPPIDPMYADLPIPQRDLDRAQELLAEAGYENGLELELHTTAGRVGLQESALAFQEMAQGAGVTVEIVNHPVDAYWSDIWLNRPFYLSNWSSRPMADQILSVAYLSDSAWNEAFWSNEEFDQIVREAREVIDEDERFELYRRAQEILAEDGGVIIPYFMSLHGAWGDHVQGYRMHPLRQVEFHKVWLENVM